MSFTYRNVKGSELSYAELDENFQTVELLHDATQLAKDEAAASAAIAVALAHFKGEWSSLFGELLFPASTVKDGSFYALLNDLTDVTTAEPGVSSAWKLIPLGDPAAAIASAALKASPADDDLLGYLDSAASLALVKLTFADLRAWVSDASGGTALPGVVSLVDYMDAYYGAGAWTQRTGVGAGSDIGPALVAACYFLRTNYGRGTIFIPPGSWLMTTTPTAAQWSGHTVRGAGSMATVVVYNASSGVAFNFSGGSGYTGGGIHGISLHLESGKGNSSAYAFQLQGDATYQPDQMSFSDIYCSALGTSYWYNGFTAIGTSRTSPQGIRVADINNLQVFRCHNVGIYLQNIVQWTMRNVGVYAGTTTGNNFYLAGGGASNTNSVQVYIDGLVATEINLTNCSKFQIGGTATTVGAGTTATLGDVCVPGASLTGSFGAGVRTYFG